jgi:glutaredoxin-like protein NrdH
MVNPTHIPGTYKNKKLLLYALSTCPMCRGVKELLQELDVEYDYIDVDLLDRDDRTRVKDEMKQWHERSPFPMLVINNSRCVIGDEPEAIKKAINDE